MSYLVISFVALAVLYGIERLYFSRTFGVFAFLFWLFVLQASACISGELIFDSHLTIQAPGLIKLLGEAIATFALITIGFTPIAGGLGAVVAGLVLVSKWLKPRGASRS